MQRRNLTKLGVTVFLLAAAAVVIWKHPWSGSGGPDLKYDTVQVDKGSIAAKVSATGTLSPRHTVQVGAQVSGRILELDVDFNDHVNKGQVIAKLDPALIQAQIVQNQATVAAQRAALVKAQVALSDAIRQNKRTQSLAEQKLIAAQTAEEAQVTEDTARASVASSQANLAQAQATLSQQQLNLTYTTIESPVDGTVISRAVDVGQTVQASLQAPTLYTIAEDLSRMQIDTSVAEGDVGRLTEAMKARFTVDAFPGHTFEGVVRQIRNSATTVSGVVTYDAVIDVDNSQKEFTLRPGMTANVTFVLDEVASVVRIPNAALRFKPTPAQMAAMFGGDASARGGRGRRGGGGGSGAGSAGAGGGGGSGGSSSGGYQGRHGGGSGGSGSGSAPASAGATATADPGGSGGPGGGGDGSAAPDPSRKTVWKLVDGKPKRASIKVGLTDGSKTQLVEGDIQPGDQLITAVTGAPVQASGGPGGGMRF